jgi:hypothetical protein
MTALSVEPYKEDQHMKRMWRHKWVVVGVSLVIFLSLGTVAWAATGNGADPSSAGATAADNGVCIGLATGQANGDTAAAIDTMRTRMKERRDQFIQRQEALLNLLRDKMSTADQATYDKLVQQAKDQRAALEKARTDLQTTMKDLRDLTQKYIGTESGATGTSTQ